MSATPAPPTPATPPATLRAAQPTDAGRLGAILFQAQQRAPWQPELYTEVEMIAFCGVMIDRGWVTVALQQGVICGFIARDGAEVCSLYLAPGACGQGLGAVLLASAKQVASLLWLQVLSANEPAQRFYQNHGFYKVSTCDGQASAEGLPNIRLEWRSTCQEEKAA